MGAVARVPLPSYMPAYMTEMKYAQKLEQLTLPNVAKQKNNETKL